MVEALIEEESSLGIRMTLALRGLLEFATLVAVVFAIAAILGGIYGLVTGVVAAVVLAILWGVFTVPDDPSRGGASTIPVPGWARLALEFVVFSIAVWAVAVWLGAVAGGSMAALIVAHYASWPARIRWLLER